MVIHFLLPSKCISTSHTEGISVIEFVDSCYVNTFKITTEVFMLTINHIYVQLYIYICNLYISPIYICILYIHTIFIQYLTSLITNGHRWRLISQSMCAFHCKHQCILSDSSCSSFCCLWEIEAMSIRISVI